MPSGVYPRTSEMNRANSERQTGRKLSADHKAKLSLVKLGNKNAVGSLGHAGTIMSDSAKRSMSLAAKLRDCESNLSPYWQTHSRSDAAKKLWEDGKLVKMYDTQPERLVGDLLTKLFGTDVKRQGCIPGCGRHPYDFLIPSLKIAIEVDGCYWHGCPVHYPTKNQDVRVSDSRINELTIKLGWKMVRIWEHEIGAVGEVELTRRIS